jgi:RNA polymerase sigma factor (sigma-70 family)
MRRILVVDDEMHITDGLTELLGLEAFEAHGAYDRITAEEMIAETFYPVILADLRLRNEEDGLALLESIRRISPASRVAVMTGYANDEMETMLADHGQPLLLRKPLEFSEIVDAVTRLFDEATAAAALASTPVDLNALYEKVRRILFAIPQRRYGLTQDETEEVVQEAWVRYLERQASVQAPGPWLAGTVVNLCRQQVDRNRRWREMASDSLTEVGETMAVGGSTVDQLIMREALASLDERGRNLCSMIAIEGRSYNEVSEQTGIPVGSIGPLYIRAKQRLRRAIG